MREQASDATPLDSRYGRTPSSGNRSWWLAATVVACVAVGVAWYVWAGPGAAPRESSSAQATVSASNATDEHHMEVTFTLNAPPKAAVACAVSAKSEDFTIVGWKVVTFGPSSKQSRTFTQTLRTTSQSEAGFVDSCWLT